MLDGWYCRSLANQKTTSTKTEKEHLESDEEAHTKESTMRGTAASAAAGAATAASSSTSTGTANENIDYKERYRNLKRKLKFLIYENEYFQDLLHTNQRRLLKVSRDRSFLIDRLLIYEKPAKDSSDSDVTDSSNSDTEQTTSTVAQTQPNFDQSKETAAMRRKHKEKPAVNVLAPTGQPPAVGGATRGRRRKILTGGHAQQPPAKKLLTATATVSPSVQQHQHIATKDGSGNLSTAEIARQLQERRPTPIEFMSPECASATVPVTMLSDESPSKIYPNESLQHLMEDDSPSHVAAEECVPMVYTN
ncbi:protein HEG [Drosophila mojavensis]|uniref:INO80 complex subunit E N-terminal domain-containing protein n=1 Tax=Drosophila mojavensis TaxID=7230 RepID=B4KMH3_DROMO|nr:protein HEG [Drosophila mojavensis]EDW09861.1 uncharacterized protein Dmoj_GI18826 [Drosophila mojavensis]